MEKINFYDTIVIGLGASGLFFCSSSNLSSSKGQTLVLEKNSRAGIKLLMSGGGQCNFTHQGPIKEFIVHYGTKGPSIRQSLYKHNNSEMMEFVRGLGIDIFLRDDGKVFPKSLQSKELLDCLLKKCRENRVSILYDHPVIDVSPHEKGFLISSTDASQCCKKFLCKNLVIATGGCSYPATGSDGGMFALLSKALQIPIVDTKPALTPIHISDYPFSSISGVSLANVSMRIVSSSKDADNSMSKSPVPSFLGDLLFTHENLSGPLIINSSRYTNKGDLLEFNFVHPQNYQNIISQLKASFQGNVKEVIPFISGKYNLPKSFVEILLRKDNFLHRKMSSLSGSDLKILASRLTKCIYAVDHLCGFNRAMVTAGGIDLSAVNLRTMESKQYAGLFFIGEVLDVDGDTGGYNIQFAYSSAMTALEYITSRES